MVISYFASSALGIALMLGLFLIAQIELIPAAIAAVLAVAVLMPLFSRISRIAWIHIDQRADPR
jgi:hypothetical protein